MKQISHAMLLSQTTQKSLRAVAHDDGLEDQLNRELDSIGVKQVRVKNLNADDLITAGPESHKFSVMNTKQTFDERMLDNTKMPMSPPKRLMHDNSTTHLDNAPAIFGDDGGALHFGPTNHRNVEWLGDADDGVHLLARSLGWEEELTERVRQWDMRVE